MLQSLKLTQKRVPSCSNLAIQGITNSISNNLKIHLTILGVYRLSVFLPPWLYVGLQSDTNLKDKLSTAVYQRSRVEGNISIYVESTQVEVTIPCQHCVAGIHFTSQLSRKLYMCECLRLSDLLGAVSTQAGVTFLAVKARQVKECPFSQQGIMVLEHNIVLPS